MLILVRCFFWYSSSVESSSVSSSAISSSAVSSSVVVSSVTPSVDPESSSVSVCSCTPLYTGSLSMVFGATTVTLVYDGDETPCDRIDTWLSDQWSACLALCDDCEQNDTGQYLCCDNQAVGEGIICKEVKLVSGDCSPNCDEQGCCWIMDSSGNWVIDESSVACSEACECSTDGRPPATGMPPGFGWCTTCSPV